MTTLTSFIGLPARDPWLGAYHEASPATHVSADDPPILIIHSDSGPYVAFSQAELFKSAFNDAGVVSKLILTEGAGNCQNGPGISASNKHPNRPHSVCS